MNFSFWSFVAGVISTIIIMGVLFSLIWKYISKD